MDGDFLMLLVAACAFVGSHFLLSHPLRRPLVRRLRERGFLPLYSLVAIGTFSWMAYAFARAPGTPALWDGTATVAWLAASVLTIAALGLVLGSLNANPALPQAHVAGLSARRPWGAFKITRHPMMQGFALWGAAHIIVAPTPRTLVLCSAIILLAMGGAALQDRRKLRKFPREWGTWMERTSFWPAPRQLGALGLTWALAVLAWLGLTWLHVRAADIPAGIWRWVG